MMHHFASSLCWATFQAKNNVHVRSAPASSALTLVSHLSHNALTANCHLYGSGERMKLKEEQRLASVEP